MEEDVAKAKLAGSVRHRSRFFKRGKSVFGLSQRKFRSLSSARLSKRGLENASEVVTAPSQEVFAGCTTESPQGCSGAVTVRPSTETGGQGGKKNHQFGHGGQYVCQCGSVPGFQKSLICRLQCLEEAYKDIALFQRLRLALPWWERNAPKEIVNLITQGLKADWECPGYIPCLVFRITAEEIHKAREILEDYPLLGAVRLVDPKTSSFSVPWFVI